MIRPATLAPASFVLANMRAGDRVEVMCQVPDGVKTWEIAYGLLQGGDSWCAFDRQDRAACIFGVTPMNVAALSVWAIGTKHMWRVTAEVSKFMVREVIPRKIEQGYHIMEARSHIDHEAAHRWIEELGGEQVGEAFAFGRDHEAFLLYRFTADDFPRIRAQSRYSDTAHSEHA